MQKQHVTKQNYEKTNEMKCNREENSRNEGTFKVHVNTVLSAPGLALTNDDSWQHLLPEIGLPLLHGGHDHVANAGRRKTIQTTFDPFHGDDVEVLRPRVVGAVHRRRHWQTQ